MYLIIIGVVGFISSGILTQYFNKKNNPFFDIVKEPVAGDNSIPKWVSMLNLISLAIIVVGIISIFI